MTDPAAKTPSAPKRAATRRVLSLACTFGGLLAFALFASRQTAAIDVGAVPQFVLLASAILALWLGMLWVLGAAAPGGDAKTVRWRAVLACGATRAWPAALPLWALPALDLLARESRPLAQSLAIGASVLALGLAEARVLLAACAESDCASVATGSRLARLHVPEWCSLWFCLCAAGWYMVVAASAQGNADNDSSYYFGVARHILKVGRLQEPIVWHYLAQTPTVLHPAFDYWQGLTSLVLLPSMWLFGATQRVALLTMGAISGLTLLLFWYLLAVAAPLRSRLSQYVALLTFAVMPALATYRFDTESVPVFQCVLVGALVAFASGRFVLSAGVASLLFLTRGDGLVLCAMLWVACAIELAKRAPIGPHRPWLTLAATLSLIGGGYVSYNLWLHGSMTPPAARVAASLSAYFDLFRPARLGEPLRWLHRLSPEKLGAMFWRAWSNLTTIAFLPKQSVFMALVLALGFRLPRFRLTALVWCLLFLGSGLVVAATGVLFAAHRTLYTFAPLVVLAVGAALDQVVLTVRWREGLRSTLLAGLAAASLAFVGGALADLRPYGPRPSPLANLERDVRALAPRLQGAVVATTMPWTVIAVSDSPAVMIPDADTAAIGETLARFGVRFILLSDFACTGRAAAPCRALRSGSITRLGDLRVVERLRQGSLLALRLAKRSQGAEASQR